MTLQRKIGDERSNRAYYQFIHCRTDLVVEELAKVQELIRPTKSLIHLKFLDVGCGVGNIMILAKRAGFGIVEGIEYEKRNIDQAIISPSPSLHNSAYGTIHHMDAFDFENYRDFDVIYYYCPISDYLLEERLEKLIESQMKVGAYLVANFKTSEAIKSNKNFKSVSSRPIYQKVSQKRGGSK